MAPLLAPTLREKHQKLEMLLSAGNVTAVRDLLKAEHPADIADLLELFNSEQRVGLFDLLEPETAAEVLDEINTRLTRDLVDAVPDDIIADLLEAMPVDDAAEILSELAENRAEDILALMEPEDAADVGTLLAYPEDTAGRLMSTKIVRLQADWRVEQTLQYLRTIDPETETFAYLYVINGDEQLVGVVPLRALVRAPSDRPLSEIMTPSVISAQVDTDQEDVARMVAQYDFAAIPIVDTAGRLVGVVTHDDVVDILQDEFTEDMQRLGGSQPLEDEYLSTPVLTVIRKRVGWLMILFFTALLTGTVMRHFEQDLEAVVALSFFIPLLIGTGGNAGAQTTSTIIRAIGVGEVRFRDTGRLLWHEAQTGLLLGLIMGVAGFVRAITWDSSLALSITVAVSLFVIVLWSNMIGSLLPPLAARLKIDPAVISSPVMSTLVDATGLFIYFTLARLIIGL